MQQMQNDRWVTVVASCVAVAGFALLYVEVTRQWQLPAWVGLAYGVASVVCFGLYAVDKAAAARDESRVPERTLLLVGLVGGWPGALIARQLLRHKLRRASFSISLWETVAVNVLVFLFLCSPLRRVVFP